MLGKKPSEKSVKKGFSYSHEYREKKWGKETREIIVPETHEKCYQKSWEKIRRKKVR